MSDRELEQRQTETTVSPDATEVADNQVTGTSREPDYTSSPDVAVDGSLAEETVAPELDQEGGDPPGGPGPIRAIYYKIRATFRAPFSLLRRYFIPILAFAVVFGGLAYLIISAL